jgi:hypothetical protein
MKDKLSPGNNCGNFNKGNALDGLTGSTEKNRGVYPPEDYKNSEKRNKTWCSYMERGFRASQDMTDHQKGDRSGDSGSSASEETASEN